VYNAENTRNPTTGLGGFGQGIFDVFRGDLLVDGQEQENTFVEVGYVHVYNFPPNRRIIHVYITNPIETGL